MLGVTRAIRHRAPLFLRCYCGHCFLPINRRSIHISPALLASKEQTVGHPERRAQARTTADPLSRVEIALDEDLKPTARDVLFPAPIDKAATPSIPTPPLPGQPFLPEEPLGDPSFSDRAWLTPPHWIGGAEPVSEQNPERTAQERIGPTSTQPPPNDSSNSDGTSAPRTVADPLEQ